MRQLIKKIDTAFHMVIHALCGAAIGHLASVLYGVDSSKAVSIGVFFSLVPDFEHFVFFFTYGSKTDYAKTVKSYLKKLHIRSFAKFCAHNHKFNTGLFLHNIYVCLITFALGFAAFYNSSVFTGIALLSIAMHHGYDMLEDYFLLGKLNPNWFLRVKQMEYKTTNQS